MEDINKVTELLHQLTSLSIEAPSYAVDANVSVFGHVKQIHITITLYCSIQMYLNGNQPDPLVQVSFGISDIHAETHLHNAISTMQDLMVKHNKKDAA